LLIKNGAFLIKNGAFLIKNGAFLISNGAFLISNGAFLISNGAFLIHSARDGAKAPGNTTALTGGIGSGAAIPVLMPILPVSATLAMRLL
jgi:hypothetical protein